MIFSVSNISWNFDTYDEFYNLLKDNDIHNLEICPFKICNSWELNNNRIEEFKKTLKKYDIKPYSFQSIFYKINGNIVNDYDEMLFHFKNKIIPLSKTFNIKKVVFGSPKSRMIVRGLTEQEIIYGYTNFFSEINKIITSNYPELLFCVEPNSKKYGCELFTNSDECIELISQLKLSNIVCHIDTANLSLENENGVNILNNSVKHFHVSEPFLKPFNTPSKDHTKYSKIFKKSNIESLTIEMLSVDDKTSCIDNLITSVNFVKNNYL